MSNLGPVVLDVGIPLSIIGMSRLDWVADNFNNGVNLTGHVGAL